MPTLILPPEVMERMVAALKTAGQCEIGGILMAEHVGPDTFRVREITVHRRGAIASFVRRMSEAVPGLRAFFRQTGNDYRRFNYLGEWHSHPLFSPFPSMTDDASMHDIVEDAAVGALFAALLIVKLDDAGELIATAHTYLPDGTKTLSIVQIDGIDRPWNN